MNSRIAVVGGGSGFIGKSLCKALENAGYSVTIVSRKNDAGKKQVITWKDVKNNGLPKGTHAVFNLAGELVLNPLKRWSSSFENEVLESRVNTTKLLRDAIVEQSEKPSFWGSCSGIGYYPPSDVLEYDENSVVADDSRDYWSKLTLKWEKAASLPENIKPDVRHVIMRTGVVLGPEGGALKSMYPAFFMGVGGPIMPGTQNFPWVHLDDVTQIWMHALGNSAVEGVINGVAPQKITSKVFAQNFGSVLRRPAILPVPEFAVKLMFGATRATMLTHGQKVNPTKTIQSGYRFKYSDIYNALQTCI